MILARLFLLTFLLGISALSFSQRTSEEEYAEFLKKRQEENQPKKSFRDRLVYGGNLGGFFGTVSYFQINPMVGYKTTDWWVNGIGVNYIYAGGRGYSQNVYGASVWSRAYAFESIILHTEYEYLRMNIRAAHGQTFSADVPVWLVGAGYQSTGNGFGVSFLVLYDLIQDPLSPYSSPVFRIGGLLGF